VTKRLNNLKIEEFFMLETLYIMQAQAPTASAQNPKDTMIFSVGLVITCLLVLIMLWLPDMLKGE
jgi:hypothetical protein